MRRHECREAAAVNRQDANGAHIAGRAGAREAITRVSALGTHVGAALGNELQMGVSIEGKPRRQLHRREPIHARIHLLVRDEQH